MPLNIRCCVVLYLATMIAKISSFRYPRIRFSMSTSRSFSSPPAEPINFSGKFSIPENEGKLMLEEQNSHPRDSKIAFEAAAHKYSFDGKAMDRSVTEVVGYYFEAFDADLIARKMITGNNWPRDGYMQRNGDPFTEEEIKKKWADQGEYARNTGTWMHYNIERYLNNLPVSPKSVEMPKFCAFYDDVIKAKNIQPFRTEWRIAADDVGVAGSIDFVGKFPDGTYALMDWKRAKDLGSNLNTKFGKRAVYPLDHIDDCDGSKYYLQLNIYKYILEKYYDKTVSYMAVASFHPATGDKYFMTEVPNWEHEVESVFNELSRRRVRSEEPVETPPSRPRVVENAPKSKPYKPTFPNENDQYDIPF